MYEQDDDRASEGSVNYWE